VKLLNYSNDLQNVNQNHILTDTYLKERKKKTQYLWTWTCVETDLNGTDMEVK